MVEIEWQDPPARAAGRGNDYSSTIDALKANPGKWALVIKDWKTTAAPAAFRQAGCEATTRRNADKKTWSVYVRFPQAAPKARADAGQAQKRPVDQAVRNGTALKPPAQRPQLPAPEASGGFTKFLQSQRAGSSPQ